MEIDQLTTYELWSLVPTSIPVRSRLYSLEPIGLGTPLVESFNSFFTRLAKAHCVPAQKLAAYEIAPLLKKQYPERTIIHLFSVRTHNLNGISGWPRDCVRVLEILTGRNDLRFLTMQTWQNVLAPQKLLRRIRAWCPHCYDEWRQRGKVVYDPLLWSLEVVKVCPQHRHPLQLRCPHPDCQKPVPFNDQRGRIGYCLHCERWLGTVPESQISSDVAISDNELERQLWNVQVVGELLATAPSLVALPTRKSLSQAIAWYAENLTSGNINALARKLNVLPTSLYLCMREANAIQLNILLDICYGLGVTPLWLLTEAVPGENHHQDSQSLEKSLIAVQSDLEIIRHALEKTLANAEEPPPSLPEIARQLDCSDSFLKKHFPGLCQAILKQNQDYYETKKSKLRQDLYQIMMSDEVPPPSLREVSRRLGYNRTHLIQSFPELCQAISKRFEEYQKGAQEAKHLKLRSRLEEFLHSEEVPPPSMSEIARRMGVHKSDLRADFPALCQAISNRYLKGLESQRVKAKQDLETVLASAETSALSLRQVVQRLGYNESFIRQNFPEQCRAILARYEADQAAKQAKARCELEAILASDESPPPSLSEVERRLGYTATYLRRYCPDQCCQIVARHQAFSQTREKKVTSPGKPQAIGTQKRKKISPERGSLTDPSNAARIREAIELILANDEDPPPSMREVARRLDYSAPHLRNLFPELCHAISARHENYLRAKKLQLQRKLEDVLASDEIPPPSVNEVARRLGYPSSTLWSLCAELCRAIAARCLQHREAEITEMRQQVEAIVARNEIPPPSLNEVADRLGYFSSMLQKHLPELCRLIIDRYQAYQQDKKLQLKQQLEAILASNEHPPLSLEEVSRRFGYNSSNLSVLYPVECSAISQRYVAYRKAERQNLRRALEAILQNNEETPPSFNEVARQLERDGNYLRKQFPKLCAAISDRYQAFQEARKLQIQHALENILSSDEEPPSLSEVARWLEHDPGSLGELFPDLCRAIVDRYQAHQDAKKCQLQEALEAILVQDENSPPSLNVVSQRVGYHPSQIVELFPEHARKIVERHKTYIKERKRQRVKEFLDQVREITFQIYKEGFYPTTHRVSLRLPKPGYMRSPAVRAAWRETLRELGLVERDSEDETKAD